MQNRTRITDPSIHVHVTSCCISQGAKRVGEGVGSSSQHDARNTAIRGDVDTRKARLGGVGRGWGHLVNVIGREGARLREEPHLTTPRFRGSGPR